MEDRLPYVKVIAHRGNSSQAPENTLAAFQQAINLNVDFLECDVQLTQDKIPVMIHDSTLHRIHAGAAISDVGVLTWEELKKLDVGSWFDKKYADQRMMSLEEFLLLPKGNIGSMVEIKKETFYEYEWAKIVGDVITKVHRIEEGHGPLLIGSMNADILLCLETYLPLQSFIAIVKKMEDFKNFEPIRADYYAIHYSIATKEVVNWLQDLGKEVWCWTVDDKETAKQLIDMGVKGIITNHPKKMLHRK